MKCNLKSKAEYYPQLDSLRGLAVISVVLWHYWQLYYGGFSLIYRPYLFFMYGAGAVILFFVLSGFVLANSYNSNNGYLDYLFRRVFRIYPAYYTALLISILGLYFLRPGRILWLSDAFNLWQSIVIDKTSVFRAIVLIYPKFFNIFLTPAWSLSVEMVVSIYFPLLLYCSKGRLGNLFMMSYIFILYYLNIDNELQKAFPTIDLYYSIYFILGIFIFQNWKKLKWFGSIWLLPFYIFLYASPFFSNSFANILHDRYILTGFGSLGVILVALYSKYFLQNSIIKFIGKISYSIYLLHIPIVLILTYSLKDIINRNNMYILFAFSFICTIFFSYITYKYIEKPFILIGHKIVICKVKCENLKFVAIK